MKKKELYSFITSGAHLPHRVSVCGIIYLLLLCLEADAPSFYRRMFSVSYSFFQTLSDRVQVGEKYYLVDARAFYLM